MVEGSIAWGSAVMAKRTGCGIACIVSKAFVAVVKANRPIVYVVAGARERSELHPAWRGFTHWQTTDLSVLEHQSAPLSSRRAPVVKHG